MSRRKDQHRRAVNRVNACGKNFNRFRGRHVRHGKLHLRALRFPNPVALHQDDAFGPSTLELLQIVQQLLGIRRRLQEPLLNLAGFHQRIFVTPAVTTVHHLFVRQHRAALRTPVHSTFFAIGQAALQHAQEKPLVPAVIFRLARGNLPPPVVAEAKAPQPALNFRYVFVGPLARMSIVLDRRVFRGEAKRVPAHRMRHVESAHAFHSCHNVPNRVVAHVAHVQRAAGVRQHLQHVILGFRRIGLGFEYARLRPTLLPLLFDFLRIVSRRRCDPGCALFRHAALSPLLFRFNLLRRDLSCCYLLFRVSLRLRG